MLSSPLSRYTRYKCIGGIRQQFLCLSSSAKDDIDESPVSPRPGKDTPSSPSSAAKNTLSRFPPKGELQFGTDKSTTSVMSKFFSRASSQQPSQTFSPKATLSGPPRSLTASKSIDRLTLRKPTEGFTGALSRFEKEESSLKVRPDPPRTTFVSGNRITSGESLFRPLPKQSNTEGAPGSKVVRPGTYDVTDIRLLRASFFGGVAKAPETDSAKKDPNHLPPLSEVMEGMRRVAANKKKKEEIKAKAEGVPAWKVKGQLRISDLESGLPDISGALARYRQSQKTNRPPKRRARDITASVIQVPSRELELKEVSQLFRVSMEKIRESLQAVGEWTEGKAGEDIRLGNEVVEYLAADLDLEIEIVDNKPQEDEEILRQRRVAAEQKEDSYEKFPPRPPVVTIMGHVDHGKTTLMDSLRRRAAGVKSTGGKKKSKQKKNKSRSSKPGADGDISGTEAGGITQVITAFQVLLPDADIGAVTFLDTPGHAAFKAMRQSGSDAADVIVLVIAADDGVSPQTVEIINFYKSIVKSSNGGITMMVALNKIDKPGIDVETARAMVANQLYEHGIIAEGMGSSSESEFGPLVPIIPVSGLTGEGLDDLISAMVLQSEVMDLRADVNARAEGVVLDAKVDPGLGVVSSCIIRWGSIARGDIVVSGVHMGKVRILRDVNDQQIQKGLPSQPVRIVGFEEPPGAGDAFVCMKDEKEAKKLVHHRRVLKEVEDAKEKSERYKRHTPAKETDGTVEEVGDSPIRIPVILRADADGSLMALRDALVALGEESTKNVYIDPVQTGIGNVTQSDIDLATAGHSNIPIICFNVKSDVKKVDDRVRIISNEVIYSILDEAKVLLGRYLPYIPKEVVHGRAKVKAIFDIGGLDTRVAGLQVLEGTLYRDQIPKDKLPDSKRKPPMALYRVIRNGKVVEGTAEGLESTSLRHFKESVTEVSRGHECGLSLSGFNDFQEGDEIECWTISYIPQEL